MSADVVRLSLGLAAARRRMGTPLRPSSVPGEPFPAPGAHRMRFPGAAIVARAPAIGSGVLPIAVGMDGQPLFDHPPSLPSAEFYAMSPGITWSALPGEGEGEFFARVRRGAAALGIEHVTTWRRHNSPNRGTL